MKWTVAQAFALVVAVARASAAFGQAQANPPAPSPAQQATPVVAPAAGNPPASAAAEAIRHAAEAKKYLFIFFYKTDDEATRSARQAFEEATQKLAEKAESVIVGASDPAELAVVNRFGLGRAPMPLVLALAPNGAVTRSFVRNFDEKQLAAAFVSPGMEKCVKALQDRKMVFVCVQNGSTQHNDEATQGVREFAADAQYAKTTEVITLNPHDAEEADFLKLLKVDSNTTEAVTVFMAPPGTTVGTYTGATQKDVLVAAAKKAAAACDPKSGCCPPKKPAAGQPQPAPQPAPQSPQQPGSNEKKP